MIDVCRRCGAFRPDKRIDPQGPWAICPECGERHAFIMAPLILVGGPSGGGKSTVARLLPAGVAEAVVLDGDVLWRDEFDTPESNYREFYETWLRLLVNIAQSGRPGVLVHAGAAVEENIEPCVHRRYFSRVAYLVLTASDDVLRRRLESRPAWRHSARPEFISAQVEFSRQLQKRVRANRQEYTLIDTTNRSVGDTVEATAEWIRRELSR